MRYRRVSAAVSFLVVASVTGLVPGCKTKPGAGNDGGTEQNLAPVPGVCHRLCCDNSQCAPGDTCEALEPASGSLGVCSSTRPGPGAPDGGGSVPDAGAGGNAGGTGDAGGEAGGALDAGDAGGGYVPSSCWGPDAECSPLGNDGCDALAESCDVGVDENGENTVTCFPGPNTQRAGEACDVNRGPWCVPGYHCVQNGSQ
jgi:hypothetical protein